MLLIPGCKPKKHKIWIIHAGDQGVGTNKSIIPPVVISHVNRKPDLARRARKIQHQIVRIVAVVTACFTLSFRNYTFIIFIWNCLHIVTWTCTQFQHNSLLTGTAQLMKLCVCVTTPGPAAASSAEQVASCRYQWNLRIKLASAILKQHLEKLDLLLQCRMCKEPFDFQCICYC